jgi:hypothetical protein
MKLLVFAACLIARAAAWGYCNDLDVSCANWQEAGECEKEHVKRLCPHSCAACTHLCRDLEESCAGWAAGGQCDDNVDFMHRQRESNQAADSRD